MSVIITGTGSYIPSSVTSNDEFKDHRFFNEDGEQLSENNEVIIRKFKAITGISERRYIKTHKVTSDIATFAAQRAIADAGIDAEALDYIVVAHNYGDVPDGHHQSDTVPSLASRVKHQLKIKNPRCVAYDILFGCPGWVEATIHCNAFMRGGLAKKCLVIGAEALSRVVDQHDRDSMIYSDGAGAVILELESNPQSTSKDKGILHHLTATYALDEAHFIYFGPSYNQEENNARNYIKMYGRKIYEFAITRVPAAMKQCMEEAGQDIADLKKVFIHQANEKMDEAILQRFYKLYDLPTPQDVMPLTINTLGNSSVATVPTLYDLVRRGELSGHEVVPGDLVMFASVGAGMNVNAILYRV
ncbi:MAG TPA: 3-oxoacyl-ACP synthase [Flavobacteriaceae bacterium]|nr:3-oxoacyl-ACP synthase [Flavobacteriaceae bacterium]